MLCSSQHGSTAAETGLEESLPALPLKHALRIHFLHYLLRMGLQEWLAALTLMRVPSATVNFQTVNSKPQAHTLPLPVLPRPLTALHKTKIAADICS